MADDSEINPEEVSVLLTTDQTTNQILITKALFVINFSYFSHIFALFLLTNFIVCLVLKPCPR
jgi:hypothetical protein